MAAKKTKKDYKPGMIVRMEHFSKIRKLADPDRLELFDAIMNYWELEQEPDDISVPASIIFEYMRDGFDDDRSEYKMTCEKNKENANRRWHGKKTHGDDHTECDQMPDDATASNGSSAESNGMPKNATVSGGPAEKCASMPNDATASGGMSKECDSMPNDATASSGIPEECDSMPDDANKNKNKNKNKNSTAYSYSITKETHTPPLPPSRGECVSVACEVPEQVRIGPAGKTADMRTADSSSAALEFERTTCFEPGSFVTDPETLPAPMSEADMVNPDPPDTGEPPSVRTRADPSVPDSAGQAREDALPFEAGPLPPEEPEKPKPKARAKRKPKPKAGELTPEQTERFERWWTEYPNRLDKQAARRQWQLLDPDDAMTDELIAAVKTQLECDYRFRLAEDANGRLGYVFVPKGSNWLKGRQWENTYEQPNVPVMTDRRQAHGTGVDDEWRNRPFEEPGLQQWLLDEVEEELAREERERAEHERQLV